MDQVGNKDTDKRGAPTSQPPHRKPASDLALVTGGVALFLVLIFSLLNPGGLLDGSFLSPPLIAAAGAVLLWPARQERSIRALLLTGGFLILLWFLARLSSVLAPFVVVYLLAYLFDPLVRALYRRFGVPRWALALLVTTLVVGLLGLVAFLLIPTIANELAALGGRILDSVQYLQDWLDTTTALDRLAETGLIDKEVFVAQLTEAVQQQAQALANSIPETARSLLRSITSFLGLLTTLALVPVLLFYTLKDYPLLKQRIVVLFPTFGGRRDYLVQAGSIVGNYLRGQITISAIAATIVSVALILFGVPFALLIGLLAGLLNMIPNLGIMFTYVIGVLIALIFGDPWYLDAIVVLAVLLAESFLEQSVLTPNILGQRLGLHPVVILLSLFVFGYFLGLFGLLIAVPATALLVAAYRTYQDDLTLELAPDDASLKRNKRTGRRNKKEGKRPSKAQKAADETLSPPEPQKEPEAPEAE